MSIFFILLIISKVSASLVYQKVLLDDIDAKCLDGSQGAYYIWQGNPQKVLIYIEGGGWCRDYSISGTIQNCYQRSKTDLGSSNGYPSTHTYSSGIFSDQSDNYFKEWTRIFLRYCDGSIHQGTKSDPIIYKDTKLYFRGQNITIAQFQSINKSNSIFTNKITHLVLAGQSAGGIATFHWTNYLANKIHPNTKYWSIPDSGIFVDEVNAITKQHSYRLWIQNIMKIVNQEVDPPIPECNQKYPNQLWKCMLAQHIHEFIKVPLFAAQSLYDSFSLYNIVGIRCVNGISLANCNNDEKALIEAYHQSTIKVLSEISKKSQNGYWAPICVNHCYFTTQYYHSPNYRIPTGSQFSLVYSVKQWMQGASNTRHLDQGNWPANIPCSGLPTRINKII